MDGGVDGVALGKAAYGSVPGVDVAEPALAAQECGDIALGAGLLDDVVHIGFDGGEFFKVSFDECCSFATRNV